MFKNLDVSLLFLISERVSQKKNIYRSFNQNKIHYLQEKLILNLSHFFRENCKRMSVPLLF